MIQNVLTVLFLVFLEGILSFDNALVLAVIARHLPEDQRKKALTYGMWGAYLFRLLALTVLTYLIQNVLVRLAGGAYLLYLSGKHFLSNESDEETQGKQISFWRTILTIELADIAFSSDSILASLGVSDQLWVLVTGGILGITMMRVAAMLFIRLVERFPNLERTAYLLITIVGVKMILRTLNVQDNFAFDGAAILAVASGFFPVKSSPAPNS